MRHRNLVRVLLPSAIVVTVLCSCGGSNGTTTTRPTSPAPTGTLTHDSELLQGRTIFENNCAECHGFSGVGGLRPTFTDGKLLRDFPDVDTQGAFVKQGKGAMPSFATTLTDTQLTQSCATNATSSPQRSEPPSTRRTNHSGQTWGL
jgi:mono/diheme cytochrome c family protein